MKSDAEDFLTQLLQNAQRSILKRMQHSEIQTTLPDLKQQRKPKQNIKERPKVIRTKQASLPYLKLDEKQYYDKWYIPYDQKYIPKVTMAQEQYQGIIQQYQDAFHFYKNMHNVQAKFDTVEKRLLEDVLNSIEFKQRSQVLKEMLRGQRMIYEFKNYIINVKQDLFLKKIIKDKKQHQFKEQQQ